MKIAIYAVSKKGRELAYKIQKSDTLAQSRCVTFFEKEGFAESVGREFPTADALIFVCAAGIAVRMIAPYIGHKSTDPAVLVMDEGMNYCIPILSGHLGGANELARRLSEELGTIPVITTASDLAGLTAVDMFAKSHGLAISDFDKAKELTAALLEGATIGVINEAEDAVAIKGEDLPAGYVLCENTDTGNSIYSEKEEDRKFIRITFKEEKDENEGGPGTGTVVLDLIPRCIRLGIGCRRGTGEEKIRDAVDKCLDLHNISKRAVIAISSIDLKAEEDGLLDYCNDAGIPVTFYSADRLKEVQGEFTGSAFVEEVTGVDNVCERSALAEGGRLIVKKEAYDGVTVAAALVPTGHDGR